MAKYSSSNFSNYVLRLSCITIGVSVAAMLVSTSFVTGFQNAISHKLYTVWGSHRVLPSLSSSKVAQSYYGSKRLNNLENALTAKGTSYDEFSSVFALCQMKEGSTTSVMLKGFNLANRFNSFLVAGKCNLDSASNEVMVSSYFAQKYGLSLTQKIYIHFFSAESQKSRIRSMRVVGIYDTGIAEHDRKVLYCNNHFFSRIGMGDIGGYELFLPQVKEVGYDQFSDMTKLLPLDWIIVPTYQILPEFFDWMNFERTTEWVFFCILCILIFINLVGSFLLFVVDRSSMIGVFMSLGYNRQMLYEFILVVGFSWVVRGVVVGVCLAAALLATQHYFNWIQLDETFYYLSQAAIHISFIDWIMIIGFVILVSMISLLIPAYIATSYTPSRVLRFA